MSPEARAERLYEQNTGRDGRGCWPGTHSIAAEIRAALGELDREWRDRWNNSFYAKVERGRCADVAKELTDTERLHLDEMIPGYHLGAAEKAHKIAAAILALGPEVISDGD